MKTRLLSTLAVASAVGIAQSASIYVFATGNNAHDLQVVNTLNAAGHSATLGQNVAGFINLSVISQYDSVYLQANYNYGFVWTAAQQQAMVDYVNFGGGLVTAEWVLWMTGSGYFQTMKVIFPAQDTPTWSSQGSMNYVQATADAKMNAGVAGSFTCPISSIAGTTTHFPSVKAGATMFYSWNGIPAVAGWTKGNGRVVNFNTVNGSLQLTDVNFSRLLANSFDWATSNPPTGPGVTGKVVFAQNVGPNPTTASFAYFDSVNGIGAGRVIGTIAANGDFTIPGPNVPGSYKLYVRSGHWLRKRVNVVTATSTTPNIGTITLANGDCNGDNVIDLSDYTIVVTAFNGILGSGTYDARADLNTDNVVDLTDYTIVVSGFNAVGD